MSIKTALAILFLALLAVPAGAHAQTVPMEWYHCDKDSDCVFAKGICNESAVVNKKFAQPFEKMTVSSHVLCTQHLDRYPDGKPHCEDNICVVQLPDPVVK